MEGSDHAILDLFVRSKGKLTRAEFLQKSTPKCRKPRNPQFYLWAAIREGLVKLEK